MEDRELFAKTVQVYDTGKTSRKIPLSVALDAVLWYVEQFSDEQLADAKGAIDWEHLSRSVIIKSQTKVT